MIGVFIIFQLFLYYIFLQSNLSKITFELFLEANHDSSFEVFFPTENGQYSQKHSKSIAYNKGKSRQLLAGVPITTNFSFRFDPTFQIGVITINKMVVRHLGIKQTIEGERFNEFLLDCQQASCDVTPLGLRIESKGNDSKFILRNNIVPLSSYVLIFGIGSVFGFISVFVLYLGRKQVSPNSFFVKIFASLIMFSLALFLFNNLDTEVVRVITFAILGTLLLSVLCINLLECEIGGKQQASSIVIVFSCGLILFSWSVLSFNNGIYRVAQASALSQSNHATNLRKKIQHYKASWESAYRKLLFGRRELINWDAKVKIFILGIAPNLKTILGKDNWFFEGYGDRRVEGDIVKSFDNITDLIGLSPFTQNELEQWKLALEERYYWLKEKNIDYVFALAPVKALIYPEKLPDRLNQLQKNLNKPSRYTQLIEFLQTNSVVPVVDLKKALINAKGKHQWPLYYRTDFHWNFLGSFYAYQAIVKGINHHYPRQQFNLLSIDEFKIKAQYNWAHPRFLHLAGLYPMEHQDDTYLRLFPLSEKYFQEKSDFYTKGISDATIPKFKRLEENGNAIGDVRLLKNILSPEKNIAVIGDSFSEKMLGYFSVHAQKIYNYRVVSQFASKQIDHINPDIVIQEVLSMYLLDAPPSNEKKIRDARKRALGLL